MEWGKEGWEGEKMQSKRERKKAVTYSFFSAVEYRIQLQPQLFDLLI